MKLVASHRTSNVDNDDVEETVIFIGAGGLLVDFALKQDVAQLRNVIVDPLAFFLLQLSELCSEDRTRLL